MNINEIVKASNGQLESKEIEKNGKTLQGVILGVSGKNTVSAVIYQDGVDAITNGCSSVEEGANKIIEYLKEQNSAANADNSMDILDNMNKLLDRLQIRVVNKNNVGTKTPVKESGDIAFFYQVFFDINGGGSAIMNGDIIDKIKNELSITDEDIWKKATENTKNSVCVNNFLGTFDYITNEYGYYGSAPLFVSGEARLDTVERVGGAFYIIPSSVHEVIVVPETIGKSVEDFKTMLLGVNGTMDNADILSENIFYVDNEGTLSVC